MTFLHFLYNCSYEEISCTENQAESHQPPFFLYPAIHLQYYLVSNKTVVYVCILDFGEHNFDNVKG